MDTAITIKELIEFVAVIGGLWGGYKIICEIISAINTKHDQMQKWEEYDKQIKSIKKEQCLIIYCMLATLDGLGQLGANGAVTEAKEKLNKHINKQAHDETGDD